MAIGLVPLTGVATEGCGRREAELRWWLSLGSILLVSELRAQWRELKLGFVMDGGTGVDS